MIKPIILLAAASLFAASCADASGTTDEALESQASELHTAIHLVPSATFTSTITGSNDPVDVHYPRARGASPVAVLLPGANVDKAEYATFASDIASFGFVVLVPNHTLSAPGMTGLFVTEEVVTQALAFADAEGKRPGSPLEGRVDASKLALLGHSWGGVVGLFAVQGTCAPPFCTPGAYTRPAALKAAAFWGTTLQQGPKLFPIDTSAAPVALVQGSLDGKAIAATSRATYDELAKPKMYVELEGANHYGVNDHDNPAGAAADPNAPTLAQDKSIARAALFTGLFLRAHVKGDAFAAFLLDNAGKKLAGVDVTTAN